MKKCRGKGKAGSYYSYRKKKKASKLVAVPQKNYSKMPGDILSILSF